MPDTLGADGGIANDWKRGMMFDKRLFSLADGVGRLIAAKVACQWLGLVANIAFVVAVVRMLQPLFAPVPSATAPCIAIILIAAVVRFVTIRAAARFGSEAAERVKLALREKLFNKMFALGPSYAQRVRTAGVVQSAGEGIEQIQSFFELFLPQLCYAVLAPITLFAVLAPIDLPTAATLLACAPLIVLIVGMVAMRAARVFKKYWGKYTDMGASFLDNLQGLETLKTFDADGRAARVMDEKAEQFRVMTMNVLQIQLRSLTAMDAVAYGGAAAGIGVAVWRFVSGSLSPSGVFALSGVLPLGLTPIAAVLLTILLAADFFIPLRQLGSYFHVAMNGMTSTKRIFALLDAPEPEHGSKELPEFGASGRGVGVEFRGVSYRYADADVDAGGAAGAGPDAAGSAGAGVASPRRISSTSHSDMRNADVDSVDEGGGAGDARETRYALRNVALRALPGEVTAIVGPSGSGKSTAVQLLAGTLVGYEGDVLLSEMPSGMQDEVLGAMLSSAAPDDSETLKSHQIRDLTAASLTREISIVSAHSHLFAGTLRDNLLMARADATDNELWQTLEAAHIDDFVRAQSRGLDMPITQDGANLSGGQKQRIAIARVLLRRSAVYIFDEATSSVDADSETLILQTIRALADAGATVLMVTHRMANAADADHVVVFDGGVVVEQGAHDDLMAADSTYAKLFRAQESVERVGLSGRVAPRVSCMTHASGAFAVSRMSGSAESNASGAKSDMPTTQVIARLLREVGPLRKPMAIACACGILGHLAATFLPVFGVAALFAAAGAKVWNLSLPAAIAAMIICALIRGGMRYAEQYMNHNVAFRLLALFRSKTFAALRRLAPAKLSGKGKGDLIALVTTDVELLEIFFAHTISPVVIAIATTVLYTVALLTLSPAIAVTLVIAHLTVGIVLPKLFATAVGGLGGDIRRESAQLDDEMRSRRNHPIRPRPCAACRHRVTHALALEPPCPAECQEWRFRRLRRGAGRTVHCHRGIAGDGHVRYDDAHRFRRFRRRRNHSNRPFRARRPPDCRFRAAGQLVRSDARVERAAGQSHANVCSRPPPVRADGRNPRSGGAGRFPAALPWHVHARRHVRLRQFERGSNFRKRCGCPRVVRRANPQPRLARRSATRHPRRPRPVRPRQIDPAEAAHALLGPAIRLGRPVRGAAAADRRASSPSRANDDGAGNLPVRRHYP